MCNVVKNERSPVIVDRVILHSDCNSFYASVEVLHNPELRGKPVTVGGDVEQRHGIVLASTPEAKKFGIRAGEALWQARMKCPALTIIPPHYEMYRRFSNLTREIYTEYTDLVEPFGLDEAWLDVTASAAVFGDGMSIAKEINRRVRDELGITVSVGVSFNKVFAKLGSDYKKPDAITEISRDNFRDIVFPLPASDLLYVGKSTQHKLSSFGIHTIGDLAAFPAHLLRESMGKVGEMLHAYANGLDTSPVERFDSVRMIKSIGNSTTAIRDLACDEDVWIIFLVLADSVSRRMHEEGVKGKVAAISVRDSNMMWYTRQKKLPRYTDMASEIAAAAMELFRASYAWRTPVRSVGVSMSDLTSETVYEQSSFLGSDNRRSRHEQLETAVGDLKKRFGTYSVTPARLLKDKVLSGIESASGSDGEKEQPPGFGRFTR